MVDHLYMLMYEGDRKALGIEIPDYAFDGHTGRGRQLGRGPEFFLDESSKLENRAEFEDPYETEGRAAHLANFSREHQRELAMRARENELALELGGL